MYSAHPQTQIKDGVVVRLTGMSSQFPASKHRKAVMDIFGVSCNVEDFHMSRDWYHVSVPKTTTQHLFGTEVSMEFRSPLGFTVRTRTHNTSGEPYTAAYAKRANPESDSSHWATQFVSSWRELASSSAWLSPSYAQGSLWQSTAHSAGKGWY